MSIFRTFTGCLILLLGGVVACDDAHRPQAVMEVRISPDSAHLAPGENIVFQALPRDRDGNPLPDRAQDADWSFSPATVAGISAVEEGGRVRIGALTPGSGQLSAIFTTIGGEVPVHVHPPGLHRIEIEPNPVIASEGMFARPRAVLLDENGEELNTTGFRISWQIQDSTIASIPIISRGLAQPIPISNVFGRTTGAETLLRLFVNGRLATATVVVVPEPVRARTPELIDASATTLTLGWDDHHRITDGYRLERAPTSEGPWTEIAAPPGTGSGLQQLSYVDSGLEPATTYHYRLRQCNDAGCSEFSEPLAATTLSEGDG